jgi:hypothetical protein
VGSHPRDGAVRVVSHKLELDVAVELVEALGAADLPLDEGIVGRLERDVVELVAANVRKGGTPSSHLEARRAEKERVEPGDGLVAHCSRRGQLGEPATRLRIGRRRERRRVRSLGAARVHGMTVTVGAPFRATTAVGVVASRDPYVESGEDTAVAAAATKETNGVQEPRTRKGST